MTTNEQAFKKAQKFIPGGVNSPVRAFKAVGGTPPVIKKGKGSYIYDIEDKKYIDCVMSYGPLILGHSHPLVVEAVKKAVKKGSSFGAPTLHEIKLAEMVCEAIPSVEKLRLVNSGTEATMTAVRLARAVTGRSKIIKFEGCYHGHADSFLIKAGSGAMTHASPSSPGVQKSVAEDTLVATYNDTASVEKLFDEHAASIACIIVEPVAGNMGVVPPKDGFLQSLRELCTKYNALLIFDEVMTGFRVAFGGAQTLYSVMPDITVLGKIIGGGFPIGAIGARAEIMDELSPVGSVYQAGTLSGNPVAVRAGIATLNILKKTDPYDTLEKRAKLTEINMRNLASKYGTAVVINRVGSMATVFFTDAPVTDYSSAAACDTRKFALFHQHMLDQGVYLAPSQYEAMFLSTAHTKEDVDRFIECTDNAFELFTHFEKLNDALPAD